MRVQLATCLGALVILGAATAWAQRPPAVTPETFVPAEPGQIMDVYGKVCTGGNGVTVCPQMTLLHRPPTGGIPFGKTNAVATFCVGLSGKADDLTIIQSSGVVKFDKALRYMMRFSRFKPGTVDGVPTRICGSLIELEGNYHW